MKNHILSLLLLLLICLSFTGCEAIVSNALLKAPPPAKPVVNSNKAVSPHWYEGGEGYDQAYSEFTATKAPAAIYFYTDW